jgi:anti-sigma B factor antagonist
VRQLDWRIHEQGDAVRLSLAGELDISSAREIEGELSRIEASKPTIVVLDLKGVTFMDSTGLRVVVRADARAREGGWRLAIVRGPEAVQRVFRITRLEERLDLVDDATAVTGAPGGG